MATFIMLTRLSHQAIQSPASFEDLSHRVSERIRQDLPEVEWKQSFVVLGPADYLDIFSAPDIDTAMKVATVIRTFGHATTEVWAATEWDRFVKLISPMSGSSGG